MKSFTNKETGVTLTPKNKWVEEQLEANKEYEVVGAKASNTNAKDKDIKDYTKKELVAYLKTLDIEANEDMKKDDLLALIPQE